MSGRVVLHLDMDAYFAAVEQACDPALRGRPVVVCGEASAESDYARTIVTTASYEARKFGIKTGCTVPEARRRCPQVRIVVGNPDKYVDTARQLHAILLRHTDLVEVYSIDECFVDLTGHADPEAVARTAKAAIRAELGLTCSAGLAPNKLLAKLASDTHKPDGLHRIRPEDIPALFARLPVGELWGVGKKTAAELARLSIRTAADLGNADAGLLTDRFGVIGRRLKAMGRGEDDDPVRRFDHEREIKSVGHSHTLPADTADPAVISAFLRMLCEMVAARMQKYGVSGTTVSLWLRFGDFTGLGQQCTARQAVWTGLGIYRRAAGILQRHLPPPQAVRAVGVSVSNLQRGRGPGHLLPAAARADALGETAARLNRRYGALHIRPASQLIADGFGIRERCGLIGTSHFD